MKKHERLIWIGIVLLVLFFALWAHFSPPRWVDEAANRLKQTSIEARCGVAAGGSLSSDEVSITCGLDDAGIETVIAKAVNKFNLPALVAQVLERSDDLPPELDEMALRLGLTREVVIDLLSTLGANEPADTVTPGRLAAAMTRAEPRLVVNVTSAVLKSTDKVSGKGDIVPPSPSTNNGSRFQSPATQMPHVGRTILTESERLQVECGVVAGDDITMSAARITCGPKEEDIDAIVSRLIAQSDVDQLVGDLRRGALAHTKLIDSFEEELGLSRTTVLQLLKRIADAKPEPDQAANELIKLTKKHVSLAYQLGQLPNDDPSASKLRDVVAAAVGAGDFKVAEALLAQRSQLQQANDKLAAVRKELSELKTEREIIAGEAEDRVTAEDSGHAETAITPAPERTASEVGQQQGPGRDVGAVFVSQDRVAIDSPASTAAGSVMSFTWRGPAAPDDLIFIVKADVAENMYPTSDMQRHKAGQGSPAILTAPAEPGIYEIRYFSYNNAEPLVQVPLEVTADQVSLMAPSTVSAGSVIEFDWEGPEAPGDLLFIAQADMDKNRYFASDERRHAIRKGSPATLVAPADKGESLLQNSPAKWVF